MISYNLQLACVRKLRRLSDQMHAHCRVDRSELMNHQSLTQSVSQSVRYVGIELLWQLKNARLVERNIPHLACHLKLSILS